MLLKRWLLPFGFITCLPLLGDIGLGGGVDFLYWKPYIESFIYAETTITVPGERTEINHVINADLDAGVRAWLCSSFSTLAIQVSYSYLHTNDHGSTTQPRLRVMSTQDLSRADTQLRFRYQTAEMLFAYSLNGSRCSRLDLLTLAGWVDIHRANCIQAFVAAGGMQNFDETANLWGGCLGIGLRAVTAIWQGLFAEGDVRFAAVIGKEAMGKISGSTEDFAIGVIDPFSNTTITPRLGIRLLAKYMMQLNETCWSIRAGYEGDFYLKSLLIGRRVLAGAGDRIVHQACETIGFGGPLVGLSVTF